MPKTKVKYGYVWTKQRRAMAKSYKDRHRVWRTCAYCYWTYPQYKAYMAWVHDFMRPRA